MPEKGLNVPTAAEHAKNQHVFVPQTMDDGVLAHRKTPQTEAQIVVAAAPNMGIIGKE
jgi:hypothetical protein